mgnify:CR=1 FL=1
MQDKSKKPTPKSDKIIIEELMNLAENLFDRENFKQCIVNYTQVIQYNPTLHDLTYALYMRGCAYEEIGEIEKACNDWEKAKSLGFEHPMGVDIIDMSLDKYRP